MGIEPTTFGPGANDITPLPRKWYLCKIMQSKQLKLNSIVSRRSYIAVIITCNLRHVPINVLLKLLLSAIWYKVIAQIARERKHSPVALNFTNNIQITQENTFFFLKLLPCGLINIAQGDTSIIFCIKIYGTSSAGLFS